MAASRSPPDVETLDAERDRRASCSSSSRARSRSPARSRRRRRSCSTCSSRSTPKARVFAIDTHHLFPETYELLARGRAALRHRRSRCFEGPAGRGRSSGRRSPTSTSRSRRSRRSYARSATSTAGSPASAATSRRRARTRRSSAGTSSTSSGRRTRSPTGATTTAGRTSASAACRTTRCTTGATPRSATRTRRCPARAARAAGRAPTRSSAASTPSPSSRGCDVMTRLRRLVHRASGAGKTTVANIVEAELEQRGLRRRPSRRRHRAHAPLEGARVLEGGPRHEHRAHRLGRLALARAGAAVIVSAISPYEEARRHARSLVEQHAPFVEVYVATPLEECARRDPKGLYAAAFAGEIADFTGVSAPYEEPRIPSSRLDTDGVEPDGVGGSRARAARGANARCPRR